MLAANSDIKSAFGANPTFFAVGEVGGAHATGGTDTEVSSRNFFVDIDLAKLTNRAISCLGCMTVRRSAAA